MYTDYDELMKVKQIIVSKNNRGKPIKYITPSILENKYISGDTVKVYGFSGNKYLNVKKLIPSMFIDFKYSSGRKVKTITEIWVQAD